MLILPHSRTRFYWTSDMHLNEMVTPCGITCYLKKKELDFITKLIATDFLFDLHIDGVSVTDKISLNPIWCSNSSKSLCADTPLTKDAIMHHSIVR